MGIAQKNIYNNPEEYLSHLFNQITENNFHILFDEKIIPWDFILHIEPLINFTVESIKKNPYIFFSITREKYIKKIANYINIKTIKTKNNENYCHFHSQKMLFSGFSERKNFQYFLHNHISLFLEESDKGEIPIKTINHFFRPDHTLVIQLNKRLLEFGVCTKKYKPKNIMKI